MGSVTCMGPVSRACSTSPPGSSAGVGGVVLPAAGAVRSTAVRTFALPRRTGSTVVDHAPEGSGPGSSVRGALGTSGLGVGLGADVSGADVSGADVSGADVSGGVILGGELLGRAPRGRDEPGPATTTRSCAGALFRPGSTSWAAAESVVTVHPWSASAAPAGAATPRPRPAERVTASARRTTRGVRRVANASTRRAERPASRATAPTARRPQPRASTAAASTPTVMTAAPTAASMDMGRSVRRP